MTNSIKTAIIACSTLLVLSACTQRVSNSEQRQQASNPASEYCIEQGGTTQMFEEAGKQVGYCNLPDGRMVDQWELYYREVGGQGES
ncbi:DUF333 domain-containing protein [Alginatibacterium sediminis]|uniref:DUF333 domain-containing protein n=1 Tax=Alginatibacterium sediminis TaxID=2164068 RepID=A0A420E930_9ALTE|nr:DUF333 domain-containing protein [Alginatibacterium sediminis]RKF15950.1 DUF333 domain-containing protein [Alginatibacterium sediminis]